MPVCLSLDKLSFVFCWEEVLSDPLEHCTTQLNFQFYCNGDVLMLSIIHQDHFMIKICRRSNPFNCLQTGVLAL